MSGSADFSVAQWNAFGSVAVTNNGSIEIDGTSGQDTITVGKGNYVLSGLGGGDTMTVGAGHDSFVYGASSESTGTNFDTIHGFNALTDTFQLSTAVTGIDHAVTSGMLDAGANFDSELAADLNGHLNADHAILFTATSGSLSGHTFLIVETNGVAGYQNGDLVIDVTGGIHLNGLSIADFTQPT
jgi:Ca2+-binding RTX toxin-like protein